MFIEITRKLHQIIIYLATAPSLLVHSNKQHKKKTVNFRNYLIIKQEPRRDETKMKKQ